MKPFATLVFVACTIFISCKKEKLDETKSSETDIKIIESLDVTFEVSFDSLGGNRLHRLSDFTLINGIIYKVVTTHSGDIIKIDPFDTKTFEIINKARIGTNTQSHKILWKNNHGFFAGNNERVAAIAPFHLHEFGSSNYPSTICLDMGNQPVQFPWIKSYGNKLLANCCGTPVLLDDFGNIIIRKDLNYYAEVFVAPSGDSLKLQSKNGVFSILKNQDTIPVFSKHIPDIRMTMIKGNLAFVFTNHSFFEIKLHPSIMVRETACNSPTGPLNWSDVEILPNLIIKPKTSTSNYHHKTSMFHVIDRNTGTILYDQKYRPQYHNGNLYYLEDNMLKGKVLGSDKLILEVPLDGFSTDPFTYLYLYPETEQVFLSSEEVILGLSLKK